MDVGAIDGDVRRDVIDHNKRWLVK